MAEAYRDQIVVLETNVDDCTPEELAYAVEKLFACGARDAFFTPVYMKKGRPASLLTVLVKPEQEEDAIYTIFKHTTSVGIRRRVEERVIMDREPTTLETPYGTVDAKHCTYKDLSKTYIEYESARKLAEEKGVSITEIYRNRK